MHVLYFVYNAVAFITSLRPFIFTAAASNSISFNTFSGETLYAFQTILSTIASKGTESRVRVVLDIEGYKAKREKALEDLADKLEKTVIKTKKSVTLEPMQAYERKIIHAKLQNSDKVETRSIGEEPRRRVVISLKRN